jgi:hypothetical protein
MTGKAKLCSGCGQTKSASRFCTWEGHISPRGKFCVDCHIAQVQAEEQKTLDNERAKIPKLRTMYGAWWRHFAPPGEFQLSIYRERDHCLYCGGWLPPMYVPAAIAPRPFVGRAQLDHMDPLSLGGEDSIRNAVFVCDRCNGAKRQMPFCGWLKMIPLERAEAARRVYEEKHLHPPEAFEIGEPQARFPRGAGSLQLMMSEQELREWYPEPCVTGPPREYLLKLCSADAEAP